MARQRLGQHFLAGSGWRERIRKSLGLRPEENWVEIGAGHGEMTAALAGEGRHVLAIETDERLVPRLTQNARSWPGVEVVGGDILDLDLGRLATAPFRVYGNLPYYITSPILHRLFGWADRVRSIHVVIQWEVAARIVAGPGRRDYGYLSVLCQYFSRPEIILRLPPGAFRPPPRVTSALVGMSLPGEKPSLGVSDDRQFLDFVQVCFSQKRKTLRNNLRTLLPSEDCDAALEACGLPGNARAEELPLREFARLFAEVRRRGDSPRPGA